MVLSSSFIRQLTVQAIFVVVGLVLLLRLFMMQVIDTSYHDMANENVVREILTYPSRGLIFDRNHKLVVNNEAVYDLLFVPKEVKHLDTAKFCRLLNISRDEFDLRMINVAEAKGYSEHKPQVFMKQIPAEIYVKFQEYLYQFPGFSAQTLTIRQYNYPNAAHVLGYIGEVNKKQVDTSDYYKMGDYVGVSGVERSYEDWLRGERGVKYRVVDVHNREIGNYQNGLFDKEAVAGKNITLTLDIELQAYAEELMQNKKGSIVAIEPATGEILAFVSSPSYDPALLSGRMHGKGMIELSQDKLRQPLFNRALMAAYPPGSTFKPLVGLIAMNEGIIGSSYYYPCKRGYRLGRRFLKCHYHQPCYNIQTAIEESCNAYFCHLFKVFIYQDKYGSLRQGLAAWDKYLYDFGLGSDLNLDLHVEKLGKVPTPETYNRMYGKNRWGGGSIISLGVGQGEIGMTPVQLAHMMTIIANQGSYYYPHIVRHDPNDKNDIYNQRQSVDIKPWAFRSTIEGLQRVVTHGTAKKAYTPGLTICGKTGTAQNPHGDDHSLFIGFAPRHNPQIVIAVVVENAGKGGEYAAPIGSLVLEKYVKGDVARTNLEARMRSKSLLHTYRRIARNAWYNETPTADGADLETAYPPLNSGQLPYPSSSLNTQPTQIVTSPSTTLPNNNDNNTASPPPAAIIPPPPPPSNTTPNNDE